MKLMSCRIKPWPSRLGVMSALARTVYSSFRQIVIAMLGNDVICKQQNARTILTTGHSSIKSSQKATKQGQNGTKPTRKGTKSVLTGDMMGW